VSFRGSSFDKLHLRPSATDTDSLLQQTQDGPAAIGAIAAASVAAAWQEVKYINAMVRHWPSEQNSQRCFLIADTR